MPAGIELVVDGKRLGQHHGIEECGDAGAVELLSHPLRCPGDQIEVHVEHAVRVYEIARILVYRPADAVPLLELAVRIDPDERTIGPELRREGLLRETDHLAGRVPRLLQRKTIERAVMPVVTQQLDLHFG